MPTMAQTLAGALSILGFSAEEEQTYRLVLPRSGQTLAAVALGLERDPASSSTRSGGSSTPAW